MGADHEKEDHDLQVALVRYQGWAATAGARAVVIFEGRDTAGKDGAIRAITRHLAVRQTRVVALPKPTEHERSQWFFQRYVAHLPAAGELVIFNRSWYNRAGVEVVNGFSSPEAQARFLEDVPGFEAMLLADGIKVIKLWLDISRDEQAARLESRRSDPLKALKISPLDAVAQQKWDAYTAARDTMLTRTSTPVAPWICVRADHKKRARRAIIQHLLRELAPEEIGGLIPAPDPDTLFLFEASAIGDGRLER
ncbi:MULTISPECIES: polyphosphate kinase 2 [unclassified Sphingomonas]|uniref:polyphosphate kinase 2 n=1 Tax=unclassified Sphingomonas TaxID=196159 RepID=UPI001D12D4D3|nr:polyphosphate kinase 2 [Sphingomonas sp. IC4-52]MCC2978739.1 polyphosphate kinase 2 [Sphingomonas sp. IC4-52]MCD2315974.1 polyphosphate kinase 2 [Sphingomonas sp. IC-11]